MLKKTLSQLQAGTLGLLDCGHPQTDGPFVCRDGRCLCAACTEAIILREQGAAAAEEWRASFAGFIPQDRFTSGLYRGEPLTELRARGTTVPTWEEVEGAVRTAYETEVSRLQGVGAKSCACSTTAQVTKPGPTKPGPTMPTKPKAKPRALTPLQAKLAAEIDRKSPGLTGAARATAIFNAEVQHESSLRLDRRVAAEDSALKSSAAFSTALRQYRSAGRSDLEARKLALDTARRVASKPKPPTSTPPRSAA